MIIRPRAQTRDLGSSGQAPAVTVTSLAALKALSSRPASVVTQYRATAGDQGGGTWVWRSGDQSANVTADPESGVWAAPDSASTGASGAWQRLWSGEINACWFGAVGDWNDTTGTDNGTAINAALTYAKNMGGNTVFLPVNPSASTTTSTGYYTSTTITIGERCALRGFGARSTISHAVRIVGALALSPVVEIDGGAGNRAAHLRDVMVSRAAGTVPDTSVGVYITRTDQCVLTDVYAHRHAFGYNISSGGTGFKFLRCGSSVIHKAHYLWNGGPELTLIDCRVGSNGGQDVACEAYVRVEPSGGGKCDTLNAIRTQFNQSGGLCDTLLDFIGYSDADGIFNFTNSHAEGFSASAYVIRGDAATTVIRRVKFASSTIQKSTSRPWFSIDAGCSVRSFIFANSSTSMEMNLPPNSSSIFILSGSSLEDALSCSGAQSLNIAGCNVLGDVTLSGTITTCAISGNTFYGTNFTDSSSGAKTWAANSRPSGTAVRAFVPGRLGVATQSLDTVGVRVAENISGGTTSYQFLSEGVVQSGVTTFAGVYASGVGVVNAGFTLATLAHFRAGQGTFGGSATVTNQYGFSAASTLTGATNNYGFHSNIASGTGRWNFYAAGTASNYLAGRLGIGSTSLTTTTLRIADDITGGTTAYQNLNEGVVQSDVTATAAAFSSGIGVANASFTLTTLAHFRASPGTIGASATVTNQYGFSATSALTGATNNYGFHSNIASAAGRWNFYAAGTAPNYFAGDVTLGSGAVLTLGNAYVAGAPAATGYVTLKDSGGTTYKVLVGT